MNRSCLLRIVLLIAIIVLLGNAVAISRDYQDSWVLEGLEPYFAVFMITYAITFFSEKREKWMVALAIICCIVMVSIPNLKYLWFSGRSIDQQGQYKLANEVYNNGRIATQFHGGHAEVYVSTPLIHLSFAISSIILNIPVTFSMKILLVLLSTLYPLLTYSIMKNLTFSKNTTALKYTLFISSIPIARNNYIVTGRTYGTLLVFLVLSQIVRLFKKDDRRHWSILLFFIIALAATHSTSSILVAILLSLIALLQSISFIKTRSYLKRPTILAMITVTLAWLTFSANRVLSDMTNTWLGMIAGITPKKGYVPSRLFELTAKSIFGSVKSVIVYNGVDVFLLLFTIVGLIFVLKTLKQSENNTLKFLFLFNALLLLFLVLGMSMKVGQFYWTRVVNFVRISYPIFSGIAILYVIKRRTLRAVIFLSIIFLATLQFYPCQPLIPPANTISEDLPANEPVVYAVSVNSIYQRQMIQFAEKYAHGRIATDKVTGNQIMGLTQYNFSRNVILYYPIATLVDKNIVEREYDYFLIHLPGKSGAFSEQAEMRTRELILGTVKNSSVLYTNGESYICAGASIKK